MLSSFLSTRRTDKYEWATRMKRRSRRKLSKLRTLNLTATFTWRWSGGETRKIDSIHCVGTDTKPAHTNLYKHNKSPEQSLPGTGTVPGSSQVDRHRSYAEVLTSSDMNTGHHNIGHPNLIRAGDCHLTLARLKK